MNRVNFLENHENGEKVTNSANNRSIVYQNIKEKQSNKRKISSFPISKNEKEIQTRRGKKCVGGLKLGKKY